MTFTEALRQFVERAAGRFPDRATRRAEAIAAAVGQKLYTGERRYLLYRFSHFVCLTRAAGLDLLTLFFDPPITTADTRRLFASVDPRWIEQDALRDPEQPDFTVYLGAVPELCCFGYSALEALGEDMLRICALAGTGSGAGCQKSVLAELRRAMAAHQADQGASEHERERIRLLLATLVEVAGDDFSPETVSDAHLLEAWPRFAAKVGPTRYALVVRRVADIVAEWQIQTALHAAMRGVTADDPEFGGWVADAAAAVDRSEEPARALSHPLVDALLKDEHWKTAQQQLCHFASLAGLHLTRARVMTFGPIENRVVQGKKTGAGPGVPRVPAPGVEHGASLRGLEEIATELDKLVLAGIHLLWAKGSRVDAVAAAVRTGRIAPADLAVLSPDGAELTPETMHAALAASQPAGALLVALDAGTFAWKQLKRRGPFARLADEPAEAIETAAGEAALLRGALLQLAARMAPAVDAVADGSGFAAEYHAFCRAMATVHEFGFPPEEQP